MRYSRVVAAPGHTRIPTAPPVPSVGDFVGGPFSLASYGQSSAVASVASGGGGTSLPPPPAPVSPFGWPVLAFGTTLLLAMVVMHNMPPQPILCDHEDRRSWAKILMAASAIAVTAFIVADLAR